MKLSNNASKLILSAALSALAGSILIVSGTGQAQGATSPTATDKAITTLKTQMKALQQRVDSLEQAPEIAKGETGATGEPGMQGVPGERGPAGPAGTVTGLSQKSIYFMQPASSATFMANPSIALNGTCESQAWDGGLSIPILTSVTAQQSRLDYLDRFGKQSSAQMVTSIEVKNMNQKICKVTFYAP